MIEIRRVYTAEHEKVARNMTSDYLGDCMPAGGDVAWWLGWSSGVPDPVCFAGAMRSQYGGAYMVSAGVEPEYRGQGLQARLVRARIRWAQARDLETIWTYTVPSNVHSMNTLIRCGFRTWRPPFRPGNWVYWRRGIL